MKNRLNSVSEIRMFVEKTLKTYQAKKLSLENRKLEQLFFFFNLRFIFLIYLCMQISDMTIAELVKEITVQDEFFEKLVCQNELLSGLSIDKPNNYIINCISRGDDLYKVYFLVYFCCCC